VHGCPDDHLPATAGTVKRVLYLLSELTDEDAEWLVRVGEVRRIATGSVLIREGERLASVYVVIDGWLTVTVAGGIKLARVGGGDILGELSLVDSRPASATVTADGRVALLEIPKAVLQERLDRDKGFASRIYRALSVFLADRMRSTIRSMGYVGDSTAILAEDREARDEIDGDLLDKVHLAGSRFDRIFRSLLTAPLRAAR
jgi:CRP/FNR family cyclic AMP-dependent transcriptional regulator